MGGGCASPAGRRPQRRYEGDGRQPQATPGQTHTTAASRSWIGLCKPTGCPGQPTVLATSRPRKRRRGTGVRRCLLTGYYRGGMELSALACAALPLRCAGICSVSYLRPVRTCTVRVPSDNDNDWKCDDALGFQIGPENVDGDHLIITMHRAPHQSSHSAPQPHPTNL